MNGLLIGRFQPFHSGHLATYKWMKSNFDEVYITTSDIKTSIIGSYPRSVSLKVVGIFELRAEIDQSLVLISHKLAQKFKSLRSIKIGYSSPDKV